MRKLILGILLAILLSGTIVFAHPGSTDDNGGHFNHSTSEYHYHHGYPEHQHEDGTCPYEFDDNTAHSQVLDVNQKKQTHKKISILGSNQKTESKKENSPLLDALDFISNVALFIVELGFCLFVFIVITELLSGFLNFIKRLFKKH